MLAETEDSAGLFWRDERMPYVESRRACRSRVCYERHSHPTWSIGSVDAGSSEFSASDGQAVALRPGTLVIVPADHPHACNPHADDRWSYQMLHLAREWVAQVLDETAGIDARSADPVCTARIDDDPVRYRAFCRLNALLFSGVPVQEKEAALIEFVGTVTGCMSGASGDGTLRVDQAFARRVLEPLHESLRGNPADVVPLARIAAMAGMSRHGVIRRFRLVTGMTPHAWQMNLRINLARNLIRDGQSIVSVANDLGFSDQAHLQRAFKARVGMTPGRFRRSASTASCTFVQDTP